MDLKGRTGLYSIGVAQRLTGLTGRQIRYYEEVGLLSPERTPGNQRLFSPADVERLLEIKRLLAQGMNINGVKTYLRRRAEREKRPPAVAAGRLTSVYPLTNRAQLLEIIDDE